MSTDNTSRFGHQDFTSSLKISIIGMRRTHFLDGLDSFLGVTVLLEHVQIMTLSMAYYMHFQGNIS